MGSIYYLIPRLAGKKQMWSMPLVDAHFRVATIGIVLYIASMWIAGVMQGLMWRTVNPDGTLTYTFAESVKATYPYYVIRFTGGFLYLSGMAIMAFNTWKTLSGTRRVDVPIPTAPTGPAKPHPNHVQPEAAHA